MKSAMSKSEKSEKKGKGKHKLHMHIREADGGGFRADSSYSPHPDDSSPVPASAEHNLPDVKALADHVAENYAPQAQDADGQGEAAGDGGGNAPANPQAM